MLGNVCACTLGFASFVENIGVNYTHPEFDIWSSFVLDTAGALDVDSSQYTHPVKQPVTDPKQIATLFDVYVLIYTVIWTVYM